MKQQLLLVSSCSSLVLHNKRVKYIFMTDSILITWILHNACFGSEVLNEWNESRSWWQIYLPVFGICVN